MVLSNVWASTTLPSSALSPEQLVQTILPVSVQKQPGSFGDLALLD